MLKRLTTTILVAALIAASYFIGSASGNPNLRIQRFGSVIGVKSEMIEEYKRLHADPWPGVINKLLDCNISNYSIYLRELEQGEFYLFSYFEYTGNDFDADMAKMATDPVTREWWKHTDPCQIPIPLRGEKEFWASMEEVFHMD